jgi:hypothetical protein
MDRGDALQRFRRRRTVAPHENEGVDLMGATRRGRSRVVTLGMAVVLLLGSALTNPTVAATTCSSPPDVVPVDDLEAGMMGTGWTVVEGTDPVSFDVEILGVLPDGIAPGIDFILVHLSGPVIDQTGGIAFGMSGSPVYIGGDLVGSLSFGFFASDQTYAGVTPAESMVKLFDYPDGTSALGVTATRQATFADEVTLSDTLRRQAARMTGTSVSDVPTEAEPLRVPVAVSGLNARGFRKFSKTLRLAGFEVIPYRAGAASVGPLATEPLEAGDAVGGALSVGDLTFAGVGTVTAVCGDHVLAFGHPFFWDGRAGEFPMAMYGASVVTVVPDPSNLLGPFKIANLTDLHGIIDQDRLTGIRGVESVEPAGVPVTSLVANPDLATIRNGESTIFRQEIGGFPIVPDIAAFHLLANEDVVFDRIGDGTVTLRFILEGIGPTGEPFRLVRPNMHFSPFDASFQSIGELFGFIFRIQDNPFGPVQFTSVQADASITQEHLVAEIVRVLSASSLQPTLRERSTLRVAPGDTIRVRVFLLPEGETDEESVDLLVSVPRGPGGTLEVSGGGADSCLFCFFDEEEGEEENGPATFGELLRDLRRTPRNNDLVARVRLFNDRGSKTTARTDTVVLGSESVEIIVVR